MPSKRIFEQVIIKNRPVIEVNHREPFFPSIKTYLSGSAIKYLTLLLLMITLPVYNIACVTGDDGPGDVVEDARQEPDHLTANKTEENSEESGAVEWWIDDSGSGETGAIEGQPDHDDSAGEANQLYQHDPQTLKFLDEAVEAWIDQWFFYNQDRNRFDFYTIDVIDQYGAVVIVGMCCSEPEYLLEFELLDDQWFFKQARSTPHSGYDMIREIGNSLEELLDLYGSPSRLEEIKESGIFFHKGDYYYYYDHLMTGFIVGGELPLVLGVELLGYYYCFSVAVGDSPENLKVKLGEPTSEGYNKQAEKDGYPAYVRYYQYPDIVEHLQAIKRYGLLDYISPDFDGYLDTYVFSESEYSTVQMVLTTTLPLQ